MSLTIESPDFKASGTIPRDETGEGADHSPALHWSGEPAGTKDFALIVDDPDAPRATPWVHWVIYNIPGHVHHLDANIPKQQHPSALSGAEQGMNDFKQLGYNGPLPPRGHGKHHYHFHLYALDAPLKLRANATKEEVVSAMQGHVLAEGELIGLYERK